MRKENLLTLLNNLVPSKLSWDFRVSIGSLFSFEIGEKIFLNTSIREFEGEVYFRTHCAWRIVHNKKIITSWEDKDVYKGGLYLLENKKILELLCFENH